MPGLLGKKIGMTSVFSAEGKNVPCTVIAYYEAADGPFQEGRSDSQETLG